MMMRCFGLNWCVGFAEFYMNFTVCTRLNSYHILVSDCNFYLAKTAIFRFLFKWMSYMISLGYQNHPSILGLHVWDSYLDPLLDSKIFLVVQKFAARPQKIGWFKTHTKQNIQTRPNLSKTLGTLPACSRCIAVAGTVGLGGPELEWWNVFFRLSSFISLFPNGTRC